MPEEKERSLVKYETDKGDVTLSFGIVRKYIAMNPDVTDQEAMLFIKLCQFQKLNPFLKEAYLIKYGKNPATMVVGKETFTKRAEKHPQYNGAKAGIYVLDDKKQLQKRVGAFCLPGDEIVGGWAEVHRKDQSIPIESGVAFDEYAGKKSGGELNRQWASKPATMIRKVALVQALREAFPDFFQGMYIDEEPQDKEKIADEIQMPAKKVEPVEETTEEGEVVTGTVEEAPNELDEAAEAGWKKAEEEAKQKAGSSDYFALIVKEVNTWKEASRIMPIMTKANAVKDNPEELEKLYNEITKKKEKTSE